VQVKDVMKKYLERTAIEHKNVSVESTQLPDPLGTTFGSTVRTAAGEIRITTFVKSFGVKKKN
jgi:hypothetical protein